MTRELDPLGVALIAGGAMLMALAWAIFVTVAIEAFVRWCGKPYREDAR